MADPRRRPRPSARAERARAGPRGPRSRTVRAPAPDTLRRRRALVRGVILLLVVVAVMFVFVFPARTLLAQRGNTDKTRKEIDLLRHQNSKLEQEAKRLHDKQEIERLAREQYNLVFPGEQPYVAVPPPTTVAPAAPTTTTPPSPGPTTSSR